MSKKETRELENKAMELARSEDLATRELGYALLGVAMAVDHMLDQIDRYEEKEGKE